MKKLLILLSLIISTQLSAAIGCLPGDCCPGGVPCGGRQPDPNPRPRPPRSCLESNFIDSTITTPRFVSSCSECKQEEVCGEFSNSENVIVGYQCIMIK